MNNIQKEHLLELNGLDVKGSRKHLKVTIKYMSGFVEWLAFNYRPIAKMGKLDYWIRYVSEDETKFTTDELIKIYIETAL